MNFHIFTFKVISVTSRDNAAESQAQEDSKQIINLICLIPNKAKELAKSLTGRLKIFVLPTICISKYDAVWSLNNSASWFMFYLD